MGVPRSRVKGECQGIGLNVRADIVVWWFYYILHSFFSLFLSWSCHTDDWQTTDRAIFFVDDGLLVPEAKISRRSFDNE